MPKKFLTPDEAREMLEYRDRRHAEIRAAAPPHLADLYARLFPGVSDEIFRMWIELALLGELRDPRELPPLPSPNGDHLHDPWSLNITPDHPKWNQPRPRRRRGRRG
jgi:hypothetical protein